MLLAALGLGACQDGNPFFNYLGGSARDGAPAGDATALHPPDLPVPPSVDAAEVAAPVRDAAETELAARDAVEGDAPGVQAADDAGGCPAHPPVAVETSEALASGLVAHLAFDEGAGGVARDSRGTQNLGTLRDVDPARVWTDGRFGNAAALKGGSWSGWVELAGTPLVSALSMRFSLALWIRRTGSGGMLVARRPAGAPGALIELGFEGDTLVARLNPTAAYKAVVTARAAMPFGCWTHVALTYDLSFVRLYVDGVPQGAEAYAQGLPLDTNALTLGGAEQRDGAVTRRFPGVIDDFALYTRALAPGDVAALAGGTRPRPR